MFSSSELEEYIRTVAKTPPLASLSILILIRSRASGPREAFAIAPVVERTCSKNTDRVRPHEDALESCLRILPSHG